MGNVLYSSVPSEALTEDSLAQLALDLRWSWNHSTDKLWQRLEPELWELTRNPWVVLQAVSRERLEKVSSDEQFRRMLEELSRARRAEAERVRWFPRTHPNSALKTVAYFSMEYMLSEGLPIYSGGLGNVAGDQLKAAEDLGVPVIGVGLLYQEGYFRQQIDRDGNQRALYPFNDPGQLPIKPLRDKNGDWLRLPIRLPGFTVWIRTWEAQVGRTKLYLLDTNDPANLPEYRCITSELYGGDSQLRLRQEQTLGIGGWRLLRALGIEPEVCHLNEGHAAFAILERAASYMEDTGQPFGVALTVTRAGNIFTTHTPVEAGFDRFAVELMRAHFSRYTQDRLHISFEELMSLGRRDAGDPGEPFNMAYLALRGSGAVNGVSRLHGETSRRVFQPLFPRWPTPEVPVGYVTNGVHVPTWDSAEADSLWTSACGKGCWRGDLHDMESVLRGATDEQIWEMRSASRRSLVEHVRERYARQVASQGAPAQELAEARRILDAGALTVGFARRFATYKRPNLLLRDPERLVRILTNAERPVQLLLAGKAHPRDEAGQRMIREWHEFIRRMGPGGRVVFLSDYDMLLTEQMVGGVDLWINTPRRPWEASGTSGMKVLVNGGLNASELDGWWAEAYSPDVGWAIGDGGEHDEDPAWDARDADTLYSLLEREIVPEFYGRDFEGVPRKWITRVRESMARLTPRFSANRTVREYTEEHYLGAAAGYLARAADGGKLGKELWEWSAELARHWGELRFEWVQVKSHDGRHCFEASVHLGGMDPESVRVELYADGRNGAGPFLQTMERVSRDGERCLYASCAPADRAVGEFTPRVIPQHEGAPVPLEASQILWQR